MAILSVPINYFVTYPMYTKFLPLDKIIGMNVHSLRLPARCTILGDLFSSSSKRAVVSENDSIIFLVYLNGLNGEGADGSESPPESGLNGEFSVLALPKGLNGEP